MCKKDDCKECDYSDLPDAKKQEEKDFKEIIVYELLKLTVKNKIEWIRMEDFTFQAIISEQGDIVEIVQYEKDFYMLFFMNEVREIQVRMTFEAAPRDENFEVARRVFEMARNKLFEKETFERLKKLRAN